MALALRYQECVGAPSKGRWWPQPGDTTYQHGVWKVIVGTSLANSGFAIIFGALHVSLWMGFVLITAGELKFGHLTAFQGYQMQIVMGIGQVAGAAMQLASAMGGASKIFELLDRTPEIPTRGGEVPESTMRGALFFEDLKFAFPTAVDRPVLRGLTLRVAADTTVALVGSSGCGKSTVLSLLLRFYEPQQVTASESCL